MKIPIRNIKYTVINKPDYKAVKCTGTVDIYDVIQRNFNKFDYNVLTYLLFDLRIHSNHNVHGCSKCMKVDEFNEATGKRIAESKMLLDAYNKVKKTFDAIIKYSDSLVGRLKDFKYDLINKRIIVEEDHLDLLKYGN